MTQRERLFDLSRDPGENHDEAYRHPERVAELREQLGLLISRAAEVREHQAVVSDSGHALDEATRERLRELGYFR